MQIKAQAFATGKCECVPLIFAILVSHKHHNISASTRALFTARLIALFERYKCALLFLKYNTSRRRTCLNKITSSLPFYHTVLMHHSFTCCFKRCSGITTIVAAHAAWTVCTIYCWDGHVREPHQMDSSAFLWKHLPRSKIILLYEFPHSFQIAGAEQIEHRGCFKRCSEKAAFVATHAGLLYMVHNKVAMDTDLTM